MAEISPMFNNGKAPSNSPGPFSSYRYVGLPDSVLLFFRVNQKKQLVGGLILVKLDHFPK